MFFNKTLKILALLTLSFTSGYAQTGGVKTNLLSDIATSPNLGIEFKLAPKWTFDFSGQVNFWNIHERRWRHWMVQPEARWWFCEAFQGSFWALHALGGTFNIGNIDNNIKFLGSDFSKLKDHRYQGWGVGAGIGYGYDWILAKHWNLEFEVGIGFIYTKYDRYPCAVCGTKDGDGHHVYYGPTKLSLAIEYIF